MARVTFVKKARKAIKSAGIAKGQSYYWWKFRFGGKRVSKTPPRRSQLTQSSKKAALFDAEDAVVEAIANVRAGRWGLSDLRDTLEQCAEDVRGVAEEYRDSASNMESAFPNGSPKIDELNERADEVEETANELDQIVQDIDGEDEEAILKDAMAQLPTMPNKPCAKCHRCRVREIKKNRGYGGGWQSIGYEPCPQCCKGLTVVVASLFEDKNVKGNREKVKATYVWVQIAVPEDDPDASPNCKTVYEWQKMNPVDWVRQEREAGRIAPRDRSEEENAAIETVLGEVEAVQWNI